MSTMPPAPAAEEKIRVAASPAIVIWYEALRSSRRCTSSSRVPPSTPRKSATYAANASTLKPIAIRTQYQTASSRLLTASSAPTTFGNSTF